MKLPEINSERWLDVRNLPGEKWKMIHRSKEYGRIFISTAGRVKRAEFSGGRYHWPEMIFRVHLSRKNGYYRVRVAGKMCAVHRLVAEAFIPNPDSLPEIDHINRAKGDNRVKNLRWVTHELNMQNRGCPEIPERGGDKKKIPVVRINPNGIVTERWESITDAARAAGVNKNTMCRASKDGGWIGVFKYARAI